MYVGAPDSITAIVKTFKGAYADWAIAVPGDGGKAKNPGRRRGCFFKKGLNADEIRPASVARTRTDGSGQFSYVRRGDDPRSACLAADLHPGSDLQKDDDLRGQQQP
jgi:hypothetical protein